MASNIIVMETRIKFLEMALGKMLIGCHNAPYGCQPKGLFDSRIKTTKVAAVLEEQVVILLGKKVCREF